MRALDALFAAQHGVVTRAQALAAGSTARQIDLRLRRGEWEAIQRGVYRLAAAPLTREQAMLAACLAVPAAVLSHRSAAVRLGLDVPAPPVVELSATTHYRVPGVLVHFTRDLARGDWTNDGPYRQTRAGRTVIDLASVLDAAGLEAAVDSALRERLVTPQHLQRRLDALGSRGRTGTQALRAIVADRAAWGRHDSGKERELSARLTAAGIPKAVRQFVLRDERGVFVARFDRAWPWAFVGLEFQSYRWHVDKAAWRAFEVRRNRAEALGWRVLAATEHELGDGFDRLLDDLRLALGLSDGG